MRMLSTSSLISYPVGVRNLIKERQKYLFRSLYKKILVLRNEDFFIQATGLVYHPTQVGISSRARCALVSHHALACISLRLDDIHTSAVI